MRSATAHLKSREAPPIHRRERKRGQRLKDYVPLILIVALVTLASVALQWDAGGWNWHAFLRHFMGLFLVIFAMFKLFDLPGFADGFQMYDLLAKPCRPYALAYPFIELTLGLLSLANLFPLVCNITILLLMSIGSAGVLVALVRGLDVNCACLGNILKVPLSTVALAEDAGMAAMAGVMLALGV